MPARGEEAREDRQFGPYRLSQLIATGGMAEIHLAKTRGIEGFEKYVALKMIHPNFSSDDHFIQMLIDEAKISVQLQHVNIAHTFDLGRVGDTYYIAMEYVDGNDLFRILRKASEQDRYMPIEIAVYIAKEVAAGLDYAHHKRDASGRSMGIVHRDVSPQNVLISTAGEVKLVDFGIAKATMRAKQTAVGVIKGKYYYMSPEQAWGDPVDHRTDIFSAGILLYEMLTGQMLYLEEDMNKLLDMVRRADIPPPSSKRPEIPRELDKIVMRALGKKPDLRWQTAQDYGTELEKFLHSYAPDFLPSRLATFVAEVVGPREPQAPPPVRKKPPTPEEEPRVTRGIERKSIVLSRSEFTDENSIIYNASLGPPEPPPPPPPPARSSPPAGRSSPTGRMARPGALPPPVVPEGRASSSSRSAGGASSSRPIPANRLTTPSGQLPAVRPPPVPSAASSGPVDRLTGPLAARLAAAAASQPIAGVDRGTIDIDDVDLVPVEGDGELSEEHRAAPEKSDDRTGEHTAEVTADVKPPRPASEPPADEEPTVLDVAGLAGRTRGVSSSRPIEPAPPPAAPPPPQAQARASKRTPLAVPILKPPEPAVASSGSSLPLAAPAEPTEDRKAVPRAVGAATSAKWSAPPPGGAASSVWPPRETGDDDGEEFLGIKIGSSKISRKQVLLALLVVAAVLGLGGLAVAVFSQQPEARAYATVEVISIPSKARVIVDGRDLGETPLALERIALDRPFKLRVQLPQHEPWERTEQLSEAKHVKVVASLKPIQGTLLVESNVTGAEVFVNNRSVGTTPLKRGDLSPFVEGTVEVRKQGYKPVRQALEWKGGREVKLRFELVPAKD